MIKKLVIISIILCASLFQSVSAKPILQPYQNLQTSGARRVTPFTINDEHYLAVPQLGLDDLSQPPKMNSGNADADVLVYKWQDGDFKLYQSIPGHGNEDAEFFTIGNRKFLATASINSGQKAPYNFYTYSMLYEWDGKYFYPMQQFYGYAAKQWTFFNIGKRSFLALANGVVVPGNKIEKNVDTSSMIYEWNGVSFKPFQKMSTKWAYGFFYFTVGDNIFLALADHAQASTIYRWDGRQFVEFQRLNDQGGGRAFQHFKINKIDYLAYANILNDSQVLKWDGKEFVTYQVLPGKGGRAFAYFEMNHHNYLFRVNYLLGSREQPQTALQSPLYRWQDGQFKEVQKVTTYGGADATVFSIDHQLYLGVANAVSQALRYRVDSVIYKVVAVP